MHQALTLQPEGNAPSYAPLLRTLLDELTRERLLDEPARYLNDLLPPAFSGRQRLVPQQVLRRVNGQLRTTTVWVGEDTADRETAANLQVGCDREVARARWEDVRLQVAREYRARAARPTTQWGAVYWQVPADLQAWATAELQRQDPHPAYHRLWVYLTLRTAAVAALEEQAEDRTLAWTLGTINAPDERSWRDEL